MKQYRTISREAIREITHGFRENEITAEVTEWHDDEGRVRFAYFYDYFEINLFGGETIFYHVTPKLPWSHGHRPAQTNGDGAISGDGATVTVSVSSPKDSGVKFKLKKAGKRKRSKGWPSSGKTTPTKNGRPKGAHKLDWDKVREMRELYATGRYTYHDLGEMFDLHWQYVGYVIRRQCWVE